MISEFNFTHKTVSRKVQVDKITFEKDAEAKAYIFARHRAEIADDEMTPASSPAVLAQASFDQSEIVTAMKEIAATLGITITPVQLGQIILGLPEQLIRNRFED